MEAGKDFKPLPKGISMYYVVFFIENNTIMYVDDHKFDDMIPYYGVTDIELAEKHYTFADALDACRYIYVGHNYIRAVSTGWAGGHTV